MTSEHIAGIVRAVLAALGGVLVSRGYIDGESALALTGSGVTIAVAVWSVWSKKSLA